MKVDDIVSRRFQILRFPLVVAVVFVHAAGIKSMIDARSAGFDDDVLGNVDLILNIMSEGIARASVPLFFLIAGYFFFVGTKWSMAAYRKKIQSRVRSLLLPFLAWNSLVLCMFYVGQASPMTAQYFTGKVGHVADLDFWELLSWFFGVGRPPVAYQFWFVRDLMILAILTPSIYLLIRFAPRVILIVLSGLWVTGVGGVGVSSVEALVFFSLGASCAIYKIDPFVFDQYNSKILGVAFVALIIDVFTKELASNLFIHKIAIVLMVFAILGLTRIIVNIEGLSNKLMGLANTSFFVFAAHEPLLTVTEKLCVMIVTRHSSMTFIFLYLTIPLVVTAICVILYRVVSVTSSKLTSVLAGGR